MAKLGAESQSADLGTRQATALLAFGRRAGANPDRSILASDAASLLAATFEADFSSVGEVVANGTTLMLRVAGTTKDSEQFDRAVHKMSLSATDSMAGTALETAQPVITDNLGSQKQFADLSLRKMGVVSGLTVPLHVDNKPFGTLGVYKRTEHTFTKKDICFAETIAHLLTNSIARAQSDEQLRSREKLASTILDNVDSLVFELDAELKLIGLNRACRRATGFELREIAGKPFSGVFVVPEELDLVQGILRSSAVDRSACQFESFLLTKDGNRRRIQWSLSAVCYTEGTLDVIVLTGTDRTELVEAEQRQAKAEALAQQAATRLLELRREMAEQTLASKRPGAASGDTSDPASGDVSISPPTTTSDISAVALAEGPGKVLSDVLLPETPAEAGELSSGVMVQNPNGIVGAEARTSVRRSFNYKQLIAPMYGGVMPSRKTFFQVTCENISAGGFAFYIEEEPDFDYLVIALGQEPMLTYFSARVVRVMRKDHDGKAKYLVGCRFSGRVYP
ncbi:MAG TPA: GAF domain-containing protein [Thermoguttaceae bacterium]|nr:GAF domain-containing protein [Thermoguttaceae bacterium]